MKMKATRNIFFEILTSSVLPSNAITDLAYGQYALLQALSSDILEKLKECFLPERAVQIYTYGLILCANGFVHLDQVDEFYQESIMSLQSKAK